MGIPAPSSPSLRGHCGTAEGLHTATILSRLGSGTPLPSGLRFGMETSLPVSLGHIRLHTDSTADRLAEYIGAEAFAIHGHIAFRRGRFQPESCAGAQLLRHEIEHTLETWGPLRCWFTVRYQGPPLPAVPPPDFSYRIGNYSGRVVVTEHSENTHKALTRAALLKVGGFGQRAWEHILYWVEEVDNPRYKTNADDIQNLVRQFPELGGYTVGQVHSFRFERVPGGNGPPVDPRVIGMSGTRENSTAATARLLGQHGGLIGHLLVRAAANVNTGGPALEHGLHLLGLSLHTIQDYFSHYVPVTVPGAADLRAAHGSHRDFWILEDDPAVDGRIRWKAALTYSQHQLWNFRSLLNADHPPIVWKAVAQAASAP